MSHNVDEFPVGTIVNPEHYSFRIKITGHGDNEIFARVIKAEYLYPHAQVQPFKVGQELRFVPGIVLQDGTNVWNLDDPHHWFNLSTRNSAFYFEFYR